MTEKRRSSIALRGKRVPAAALLCTATWWCSPVMAQAVPLLNDLGKALQNARGPGQIATTLQIALLITVLSLTPALLIMVTSFTRILVVLAFVRQALAMPNVPPNQMLIGISLMLTVFVMSPVWDRANSQAVQPYMRGEISDIAALGQGVRPFREFMLRQTRSRDLALFIHLARMPKPRNVEEVPLQVVIPAFVISELKTAFEIGFVIYIPFLVIDMVIATILMSMGMMMLPPMMVSLPFKILLFVLVDGWHLIARGVVMSFK